MDASKQIVYPCCHCSNETPHSLILLHEAKHLYEQILEDRYHEPFEYFIYGCGTCNGLTVLGGFSHELHGDPTTYKRLFPTGPTLLPPGHMLPGSGSPVPSKIIHVYEEAWPLRQKAPSAFVNQIRRALEFVCQDQNANGNTLAQQLQDLAASNVLPATVADLAKQLRHAGNQGSHADEQEIDIWDAELVDHLFRMVIEYVYLIPAKVKRLEDRLSYKKAT